MEEKLVKAFDAVHMREGCITQIQQAMAKHRRSPSRPVLRAAAAACVVFMMIVVLSPATAQAVEEIIEKASSWFRRAPGTIVLEEDYVYYNDGRMEIDSRPGQATGALLTSSTPSWLKVMDGRVYFTGTAESTSIQYFLEHKEEMDITGQFSSEEPFTAIFEKDGITHYIAVGGDFDPENPGDTLEYLERLRRTDKIKEGMYAGWIGGSGSMKYRDAEASIFAIWYAKAVVELDLPWDYTEAKQQLEALEVTE